MNPSIPIGHFIYTFLINLKRATNILLLPLAYVLLSAILRFLYGGFSGGLSSRSLGVIMHLTFPMFVFFSLFYYTDNGSLLSVILYLQLNLLEASLLVTVPVGFISLLFRQTNIIWLLYSTAISILYRDDEFGEFIRSADKQLVLLSDNFRPFTRYFWDNITSIAVYLVFGLPSRIGSIINATFRNGFDFTRNGTSYRFDFN